MSEISAGGALLGPDAKGVGITPFPYHVVTDYGNQLMTITLAGQWTGQLDTSSPISMTVVAGASESVIMFCFKLALPGEKVTAKLSDGTTTYSLTLAVPF